MVSYNFQLYLVVPPSLAHFCRLCWSLKTTQVADHQVVISSQFDTLLSQASKTEW